MSFPILSLITFVPLLGSILCLLPWSQWKGWSKDQEEDFIRKLAIVVSLIPLILAIYLWAAYDKAVGGYQFEEMAAWIPALGVNYHMGVDGLSVPLVFLTALLTTLGLYYSSRVIKRRVREFFMLFLMLEMGMMGVFVSLDFVLFYVFWEIGLVPMYFLIGIWGQEKDRPQYSAIKFFLYTLVGSVAMLLAILGIYFDTGTFDIVRAAELRPFSDNLTLASLAFWGFFLAFAIKMPAWPFHTWLPDAHTAAPTAGSVILAGVLLKLGAYGLIRINLPVFPEASKTWAPLMVALGVISIVYGAFVCMAQTDLKRLIAYSSVSHMGYVMLGVGAAAFAIGMTRPGIMDSAAMALNGAALQMFNHGIITGGLFFLVGVIYERAHTRELNQFGGLSAKVPYFYGIMMVTGLASLGLPGLAGFWSEFFVFRGAFDIVRVWAAIGVIGIVITAAYILWRIIQSVFLGQYDPQKITHWTNLADGSEVHEPTDMLGFEKATLWPLVFFMILFGVYPTPILNFFNGVTTALMKAL
ncbi:MAG: NADH-quinone oxidoreductase subunit M [Chloroflexi bacterium]|nr:NADH-quinone oxidoreductase subunit M [Chloroflexota bacterium]